MSSILERIVADKRRALHQRMVQVPMEVWQQQAEAVQEERDFAGALRGNQLRVIAEVKKASPSRGVINASLDAADMARRYVEGGATATSVLTDGPYFAGSLDDLVAVRRAVDLPVLRKDFLVHLYQVYEARAHGADAVLLIAAILEAPQLRSMLDLARTLKMEALVETRNQQEIEMALEAGATVVGINNRNLDDMTVDLATTERLRHLVPPGVIVVSESGVRSAADARRLWEGGVNAILVGESLVTATDPVQALRALLEW